MFIFSKPIKLYKFKKIIFLFITIHFLVSCTNQNRKIFSSKYIKDTNGFNILMQQFAYNIENIWGINEILIAGPKDFIKYTDQYKTRSHINFNIGEIIIETISEQLPIERLKHATINILLMNNNSNSIDLKSNKIINLVNKQPFLYKQVLDHNGQNIRWKSQAIQFTEYLLKNKLQQRKSGKNIIWFIHIKLVSNHLDKRANQYLLYIHKAAKKYKIDQSLILAIIQIESNFNPYAVSNSNAFGLMQIMPNTAGKDVFRMQGKKGIPSRKYLFNPINNINIGTAYLSLLQNVYFSKINNYMSRHYATIAAYNSGINNVFKVFHINKNKALNIINHMSPKEVYNKLTSKPLTLQTRNYLIKVNKIQQYYYK